MKFLGICIIAIGILTVAGSFILTPTHSFNAVDSNSGISASAGLVYGGLIVFGIGLVMYMTSVPYAGEKNKSK
jgi:hypothetical protein